MRKLILKFRGAESGSTAMEYAFIATLIAVAILVAIDTLGTTLNTKYASISNGLK